MNFDWTDERVNRLRLLWANGWSASQIARDLGTSRNSCIGKVHRLGLPGRVKSPSGALKKRVRKPRSAPKHPWRQTLVIPPELTSDAPAQPVEAVMETPVEQRCSILELTSETCRWPLWGPERREGLYCGGNTIDGLPYCGHHSRMAYRPAEPRQPKTWQHWRAA